MFKVILKQSYYEMSFLFDDWNEACDFAGTAVEHGNGAIEVKLKKEQIIITTEEAE